MSSPSHGLFRSALAFSGSQELAAPRDDGVSAVTVSIALQKVHWPDRRRLHASVEGRHAAGPANYSP
jgi:hypothetical protein